MKKKIIVLTGLIVFMLVAFGGFTYAIFTNSKVQEGSNSVSTYNCLDIQITGEEEINLDNAFPIEDAEGLLQTPYKFKVKNKCNHYVKMSMGVELLSNNEVSSEYLKAEINKPRETKVPVLLSTKEISGSNKYYIKTEDLGKNEEREYELRVWIDYNADNTIEGKEFKGKLIIDGKIRTNSDLYIASYINGTASDDYPETSDYTPRVECNNNVTGYAYWDGESWVLQTSKLKSSDTRCDIYFTSGATTLRDAITASNTANGIASSPATSPGKVISTSGEKVFATTTDDYGTSYYYRGNIPNNYLIFAGKCWRIVRVDGAGNIKLFLWNNNGTDCTANSSIGTSAFNDIKIGTTNNPSADYYNRTGAYTSNRPAGVGLMYGDAMGSTYATVHANTNDSTILTVLKYWYDATFSATEKNQLADVIWCNDKSLASNSPSTTGADFDKFTFFKARERIYAENVQNNMNPSLVCPNAGSDNKLSKFTASDTTRGNGKLKSGNKEYKIGLLTVDEAAFAGGRYYASDGSSNNTTFYLLLC